MLSSQNEPSSCILVPNARCHNSDCRNTSCFHQEGNKQYEDFYHIQHRHRLWIVYRYYQRWNQPGGYSDSYSIRKLWKFHYISNRVSEIWPQSQTLLTWLPFRAYPTTAYNDYKSSYSFCGTLPTVTGGSATCLAHQACFSTDNGFQDPLSSRAPSFAFPSHPYLPEGIQTGLNTIQDPRGLTYQAIISDEFDDSDILKPMFPDLGVWSCTVLDGGARPGFSLAESGASMKQGNIALSTAVYLTTTSTLLETAETTSSSTSGFPSVRATIEWLGSSIKSGSEGGINGSANSTTLQAFTGGVQSKHRALCVEAVLLCLGMAIVMWLWWSECSISQTNG